MERNKITFDMIKCKKKVTEQDKNYVCICNMPRKMSRELWNWYTSNFYCLGMKGIFICLIS